jgi:ABC-2 type transport system permease protein
MASGGLFGRLAAMLRKDLLRRLRSPLAVIVVLAFPVLFTLILSLAMGGAARSELPKIRLLVENRDDGLVGRLVLGAFGSEQLAERFEVETVGEEGRQRLERGEASALLILPEGLSQSVLDGTPTTLELVRNPAQSILPEIAEQTAVVLVDLLDGGSRLLRGPLDQLAGWVATDREPTDAEVAQMAVLTRNTIEQVSDLLFPPAIELETGVAGEVAEGEVGAAAEGDTAGAAPLRQGDDSFGALFLMVLLGVSVLSLFMLGELTMRDLYAEQELGTLRRQLAGPFGAGTVVAGKALATAGMSAIGLLILAVIGWIGGGGGVSLPGFLIVSASLVLAITGFNALVFGVARTERQASTFASMAILAMGMVGGAFIPLRDMPGALRQVAPFSLIFWGADAYTDLLRGADWLGVAGNAGVLAAFGAVTLWIGSLLLHRRLRRTAS